MASTEVVTMTDDLDPTISEGVETVTFFDPETGDKVELELGDKNAKALAKAISGLTKYLEVARVIKPEVAKKVAKSSNSGELTKIREWANANGYTVGDRGRIKAEIVDAYQAAQAKTAADVWQNESGEQAATEAVSDAERDSVALIESEKAAPVTESELQAMLLEMAVEGKEPTAADLKLAE